MAMRFAGSLQVSLPVGRVDVGGTIVQADETNDYPTRCAPNMCSAA